MGVALGIATARFGCFLTGCCFGSVTNLPWGVNYTAGSPAHWVHRHSGLITRDAIASMPVHPTQLYEAVGVLLIYGFLQARNRKGGATAGELMISLLMSYATLRFVLEFFRGDRVMSHMEWGWSASQYACILLVLFLALIMVLKKRAAASLHFLSRSE